MKMKITGTGSALPREVVTNTQLTDFILMITDMNFCLILFRTISKTDYHNSK